MGSIFRTEGLSAGYGRKVVLSGAEITAERGCLKSFCCGHTAFDNLHRI